MGYSRDLSHAVRRALPIAAALAAGGMAIAVDAAHARQAHPGIVLKASGKSSDTVPLGTRVTIAATLTGKIPKSEKPAQIKIVGKPQGATRAALTLTCRHLPCTDSVSHSAPVTWLYQAALYGKDGKRLAKSGIVKVEWFHFVPPVTEPTVISMSDGSAATVVTFAGPQSPNLSCRGATQEQSHCNDTQNVGATLALTATLDQPIPSGDQLWIIYASGNALDPEYGNCDQNLLKKTGGLCVIGMASSGKSAPATITLPADKGLYGGMHNADVTAKLVSPQGDVGDALLSILICQQGQSPVCG